MFTRLDEEPFGNKSPLLIQQQPIKAVYFGRVKEFISRLRHAVSANDGFLITFQSLFKLYF